MSKTIELQKKKTNLQKKNALLTVRGRGNIFNALVHNSGLGNLRKEKQEKIEINWIHFQRKAKLLTNGLMVEDIFHKNFEYITILVRFLT